MGTYKHKLEQAKWLDRISHQVFQTSSRGLKKALRRRSRSEGSQSNTPDFLVAGIRNFHKVIGCLHRSLSTVPSSKCLNKFDA